MEKRKRLLRRVGTGLLFVAGAIFCTPLVVPLTLWLPLAPLPAWASPVVRAFTGLSFFLLVTVALGLLWGPVCTLWYGFKRQKIAWAWLVFSIFAWASLAQVRIGNHWRRAGLIRITQNAKPIIAAIEKYKAEKGKYPANLDDLVPGYIATIPYTGAPGYPEFRYVLANQNTEFKSYQLWVRTSTGFLNWDYFFYWPEKNYPPQLDGQATELIGEWAYLHE
jgi:hypothetical protein